MSFAHLLVAFAIAAVMAGATLMLLMIWEPGGRK